MPCKTGSFLCLGFLETDLEISVQVNIFNDIVRISQQCCRQEGHEKEVGWCAYHCM